MHYIYNGFILDAICINGLSFYELLITKYELLLVGRNLIHFIDLILDPLNRFIWFDSQSKVFAWEASDIDFDGRWRRSGHLEVKTEICPALEFSDGLPVVELPISEG